MRRHGASPSRPRTIRPASDLRGPRFLRPALVQYGSRNRRLKILPESSRGRSRLDVDVLRHLVTGERLAKFGADRRDIQHDARCGSTTAISASPNSSSGIPNTAQSWSPGTACSAASISAGYMLTPPEITISRLRSQMKT